MAYFLSPTKSHGGSGKNASRNSFVPQKVDVNQGVSVKFWKIPLVIPHHPASFRMIRSRAVAATHLHDVFVQGHRRQRPVLHPKHPRFSVLPSDDSVIVDFSRFIVVERTAPNHTKEKRKYLGREIGQQCGVSCRQITSFSPSGVTLFFRQLRESRKTYLCTGEHPQNDP